MFCADWKQGRGCPLCLVGLRGKEVYRGHFGWHPKVGARDRVALQHLRRRAGGGNGEGASARKLAASPLFEKLPALWEFLTAVEWKKGDPRTTGTLTIFAEEGMIKVSVNDRDQGSVAFVSGKSLEEVLEGIEVGLVDDTLDWRASRGAPGKKAK